MLCRGQQVPFGFAQGKLSPGLAPGFGMTNNEVDYFLAKTLATCSASLSVTARME
jgi:hypothetical protein